MWHKLILIFTLAFITNWIWENAHSFLYVHYQGGAITQVILFHAALVDAGILTLFGILFLWSPTVRNYPWLLFVLGVIVAVGIEWHALSTERWAYNNAMPILPLLRTGLTPTIQLGLLSYGIMRVLVRQK